MSFHTKHKIEIDRGIKNTHETFVISSFLLIVLTTPTDHAHPLSCGGCLPWRCWKTLNSRSSCCQLRSSKHVQSNAGGRLPSAPSGGNKDKITVEPLYKGQLVLWGEVVLFSEVIKCTITMGSGHFGVQVVLFSECSLWTLSAHNITVIRDTINTHHSN